MADEPVRLDSDPGGHFEAEVPDGQGGTRRRVYADALSMGDDLRKRVMTYVTAKKRQASARAAKFARESRDSGMRVGYAFWGFLGDHKEDRDGNPLSTPDGNATYSWALVYELRRRGHKVFPMMQDRDFHAHERRGMDNFKAFAQTLRWSVYGHLVENGLYEQSHAGFPDLDLLLLEWRWPIPGRNTPDLQGSPSFQPDYVRQLELLRHYTAAGTRVVVWDLDHKLTAEDEREWGFEVVETSVVPRHLHVRRRRVEPPCIVEALHAQPTLPVTEGNVLAYIGSRYERDDVLDEWIRPIANRDRMRGRIHFYGKWEQPECGIRWPGVAFHERVTVSDFPRIYSGAAAVPLLAKRSYMETGFVTPRVWEGLMFGALPIGLAGHVGVGLYVGEDRVAADAEGLADLALHLHSLSFQERDRARREAIDRIAFMDAQYFVNTLMLAA